MSIRLDTLSQLPLMTSNSETPTSVPEAAQGLESIFLRFMMKEMRKGQSSGFLDGGYAGGMFRELLDEATADAMAASGGIGLASVLEQQLGQADESVGNRQKNTHSHARAKAAYAQPEGISQDLKEQKLVPTKAQDKTNLVETTHAGGR